MNKINRLILTAAAVFAVAACQPKAESSVADNASSPETAAASEASMPASGPQTLTSKDNAISLTVANAAFEDQVGNTDLLPEGIDAGNVTLLQHDSNSDITVYVANLGKTDKPAETYYADLKQALESAQGLSDLKVGVATENRMDYRFRQDENGLQEHCTAIYHPSNLYDICAFSQTATPEQLAGILKDVKLLKTQ